MNRFTRAARLPVCIIAACCGLFVAACTWTEYAGAKHKTFLTATRFEWPSAGAAAVSSPAAAVMTTDPGAAAAAVERAAHELPESIRQSALEQALKKE